MKRIVAVLAVAALASACNKSPPPAPASEPQAAAKAPELTPTPVAEEKKEEKKIEVTESLVQKYAAYEKDLIAALRAWGEEMKKAELSKDKKPGAVDTAKTIAAVADSSKKFDEAKAQEKAGLSKAETEALREVVSDVATVRMLWKKAGEDKPLLEMEKAMKAQMASMKPEQRAEAEKQLNEMKEAMTSIRDCKDARKEHGDAAVDAVLKHEQELVELHEQLLTLGMGAHN